MKDNTPDKKKITLIADDHRYPDHMNKVQNYIRDKMKKYPKVFLPLEEVNNPEDKNFPIIIRQHSPESRGRHKNKSTLDKINDASIVHQSGVHYKDIFREFSKDIKGSLDKEDPRELYVAPVDIDPPKSKKGEEDYASIKRDQAMYRNIMDVMKNQNIKRAIFPVGSAHIGGEKTDKRLANLLYKNPNVKISLKNFYTPKTQEEKANLSYDIDNDPYEDAKIGIDAFYTHNNLSEKKEREEPKLSDVIFQSPTPKISSILKTISSKPPIYKKRDIKSEMKKDRELAHRIRGIREVYF